MQDRAEYKTQGQRSLGLRALPWGPIQVYQTEHLCVLSTAANAQQLQQLQAGKTVLVQGLRIHFACRGLCETEGDSNCAAAGRAEAAAAAAAVAGRQ
jgi:hypothetical protein